MYTYYTYLLRWSTLQRYYYGVRYANNASPEDLFTSYFTSSKHVRKFIEKNGLPDIIQIRRIFETKEAARSWENRVLRRMDVLHDGRSLNMTNNYAFRSENRTPEHCANLSRSLTGRKSPFKGKSHTPEKRAEISAKRKGQKTSRVYTPLSDDTKSKLSASKKGRPGRKHTPEENLLNSERAFARGFNKIISGTIWINNGTNNKRIKPEDLVDHPGFVAGRLVPVRNHTSPPLQCEA